MSATKTKPAEATGDQKTVENNDSGFETPNKKIGIGEEIDLESRMKEVNDLWKNMPSCIDGELQVIMKSK